MMYLVKMMTNREEGYNVVAKVTTEDEAREYVRALKIYHSPIDVYYTTRPNTQTK